MPLETGPRPSASYSRLEDDSDEDDNDVPLLSMEEALGDPKFDHHPHRSRDGFNAAHEQIFTKIQHAILRFYHLHKVAFSVCVLAIVLAAVFVGFYLRSLLRKPVLLGWSL
jgi:hypothetical protein